jgi:hypothetical protein
VVFVPFVAKMLLPRKTQKSRKEARNIGGTSFEQEVAEIAEESNRNDLCSLRFLLFK